jgi:hypothetical protein
MGIEVLIATAAVISAGSAIYSGNKQKQAADANAEMSRRAGNQEADAAVAQAEKIRKAGRAATGRANAAMAASGVSIGEGTPIRIGEEIYKDSEDDAFSTLLTGTRRKQSSYDQAGIMESEGRAARTAGYLNATSSLLSTGAKYGGWK